jgi:hypothetical protein
MKNLEIKVEQKEFYFGRVYTPAGEPPINPKNYKKGEMNEDSVREWAVETYNYGQGSYTVHAVIYWAKYFWDVHGSEYPRVKELINEVLDPKKTKCNSVQADN